MRVEVENEGSCTSDRLVSDLELEVGDSKPTRSDVRLYCAMLYHAVLWASLSMSLRGYVMVMSHK